MTITTPIEFVFYEANGTITDYSYAYNGAVGFETKVESEVKCKLLNTDGTVNNNPNFAVMKDTYGNFLGMIRFAEAPAPGTVIFIYRYTEQTQETSFRTSSGFSAEDVEKALDKLTKMIQEVSLHAKEKVFQLDIFQKEIFKLILTSAADHQRLLYIDWNDLTFKFTPFVGGQVVITPEPGPNNTAALMMRMNEKVTDGKVTRFVEWSNDLGVTWYSTGQAGLIPEQIVTDFSVNPDTSSTVILDKATTQFASGEQAVEQVPLPVAAPTTADYPGNAGVMNISQATALKNATANIEQINQRYFSSSVLGDVPTQKEITNAWEGASGLVISDIAPGARLALYDIPHKIEWVYYTDSHVWFVSTSEAGPALFTNTSAGIIKGKAAEGQVFAENDGTGSVYGWDELKSQIKPLALGEIYCALRSDVPVGARYCGGDVESIANNNLKGFVDFIVAGKIPTITFAEYEAELVANGGVCGKIGYDPTGQRLRWPTIKDVVVQAGAFEANGSYKKQSLPNITGTTTSRPLASTPGAGGIVDATGAFSYTSHGDVSSSTSISITSTTAVNDITRFNASNSSSIYKDGANVQQNAVAYRWFIQVSSGVIEASEEVQAEIITSLENKQNKNERAFEKNREIELTAGTNAVKFVNGDKIVALKVTGNNVTALFDFSDLTWPEYFFTVQLYFYFPNGTSTVSLGTPGKQLIWINNNQPNLNNGLGHWVVLRSGQNDTVIQGSDAGEVP